MEITYEQYERLKPCLPKFPPMSGALNISAKNKDRRDRIAENFLASFMCVVNDFTYQNYTNVHIFSPACQKYKIENLDVGRYQIRMATNKYFDDETTHIQAAMRKLSAKLEPQIYELEFLRDEVRYF